MAGNGVESVAETKQSSETGNWRNRRRKKSESEECGIRKNISGVNGGGVAAAWRVKKMSA